MMLIATVPELRAAVVTKVETDLPQFIETVAQRTGRAPDDPKVRYWSGAVAGVALMAYLRSIDSNENVYAFVGEALDLLDDGMRL